jgi:hypothetical protein
MKLHSATDNSKGVERCQKMVVDGTIRISCNAAQPRESCMIGLAVRSTQAWGGRSLSGLLKLVTWTFRLDSVHLGGLGFPSRTKMNQSLPVACGLRAAGGIALKKTTGGLACDGTRTGHWASQRGSNTNHAVTAGRECPCSHSSMPCLRPTFDDVTGLPEQTPSRARGYLQVDGME